MKFRGEGEEVMKQLKQIRIILSLMAIAPTAQAAQLTFGFDAFIPTARVDNPLAETTLLLLPASKVRTVRELQNLLGTRKSFKITCFKFRATARFLMKNCISG
jgi:hypothetical protein